MTSLLGRTLLAELLCLACILMQLLSDGVRFVRLVLFVVSLYFSGLLPVFLPSVILPFLRFVPLVVVVIPFCVFSQSEMLNATLISSFYSTGFNNFQFYLTGFNNFQFYSTGFNNFQFYSTGFNNFQFYSTGFITTLSFDLGLPFLCPFLRDPFTRSVPAIHAILLLPFSYTCATFLCNLFPFDNVV